MDDHPQDKKDDDQACEHGTALDVHCCNCHSGFIFDRNHECPPTTCERAGCEVANPLACYLPGGEEFHEWLCAEHAVEAGYCCGCGMFIAGSDDVFDSGRSSLCENCRAEADADEEADDGYPYDDEDNEDEEFDCHMGPDGSCGLAGTEECDWDCPYRNVKRN